MARHRSQAQFELSRWRLLILGPVWFLQLAFTLPLMGIFAWRLGDTLKHFSERKGAGEQPIIEVVWEAANVFLSFVAAGSTIFEMIRFWGEVLTPWTMLFTHVLKLVCACAIMALDITVLIQLKDRHYSLLSIGLDGALLVLVAILLIWIIIIYRRVSIHGDYNRRSNVKGYGFNDGLEPEYARSRASSLIDKRRLSFVSARRVSVEASPSPAANEMNTLQRTPSYYSHQRDTQFDEYMARRGSYNGKADLEAAMGAEFFGAGRHSPVGKSPEEDVVLSSGTVGSNRPGQVTVRSLSTTSSHVLVAVPEEAHEGEDEGEEDQRALLGQKRRRSSTDLGGPMRESVDIVPKWQQQR